MKIQTTDATARELVALVRSLWPPELGPPFLAPLEVVADWLREHGDQRADDLKADYLQLIATEIREAENDLSARWRA